MESEQKQWSRKHYCPAPTDGPDAKKIKFSDIQQQLSAEFPNRSFNVTSVSDAIKTVFPHTLRKAAGKFQQKHILGLAEASSGSSGASGDTDIHTQLAKEREEEHELLQRVQLL